MHGFSIRRRHTSKAAGSEGAPGGKALSVFVHLKQCEELGELEKFLRSIGKDVLKNPHIDFSKLTTTHFLRWVILPKTPEAGDKPLLAFESNYDGSKEAHLDELIKVGGQALRKIYRHCEDYQEAYDENSLAFREYLLHHENLPRHKKPYTAFFQAYAGWTTQLIQGTAQVRERLQRLVDSLQSKGRLPLIWEDPQLRQIVQQASTLKSALARQPRTLKAKVAEWILHPHHRSDLLTVLLLGLPGLAGLAALVGYQEWREQREARRAFTPQLPVKRPRVEAEDRNPAQTPLTHLVDIKSGWVRFQLLKWTLAVVQFLSRCSFNEGELGAKTAIHFARWIILEGPGPRRRLLFFSNYDGSWERYLGDFIDNSSHWLNAVWSNTQDYPKTRLLIGRGAKDEQGFKQWVLEHQHPTLVWYSAHSDKSVRNILDDIQLCSKLETGVPPKQQKELLGML